MLEALRAQAGAGGGPPAGEAFPQGPPTGGPPPGLPGFPELAGAPTTPGAGPTPGNDLYTQINSVLTALAPRLRGHIVTAVPVSADRVKVTYTDQHDKQAILRGFQQQGLHVQARLVSDNPIPV